MSANQPLSDLFKELDPTIELEELRTVFGFSSATKTAIPEAKVISLFGDDALIRFLTNLSADRAECPLVSTWVLERWDSLLVLADQITPRKLIQFNSIEIKDKKFSVGRPYTSIGVSSWPAKFDDQANVKYGWRIIRLWLLAMRYEHYPKDPADDHVEDLAKHVFKLLRGRKAESVMDLFGQKAQQLESLPPSGVVDLLLYCIDQARDDSNTELQKLQDTLREVEFPQEAFCVDSDVAHLLPAQTPAIVGESPIDTLSNSKSAAVPEPRYFLKSTPGDSIRILEKAEIEGAPHSYTSFSPMEHPFLDNWLDRLVNSTCDQSRLFGVLFWMSRWLGQPVIQIMRIPISSTPEHVIGQTDWVLNPKFLRIERSRLVRKNGWIPGGIAKQFLMPHSDAWAIQIEETPISKLVTWIHQLDDVEYIGDIWAGIAGHIKPSTFFDQNKPPVLHHRNLSALAGTFHQIACSKGISAKKVRLLAASTESSLPPGLAYTTVTLAEAQQVFGQPVIALDARSEASTSVAGSYKVVKQVALENLFDELRDAVNDASAFDAMHNQKTILAVAHLMFSTGPRPVNSPFESIGWFNLDDDCCYLEDKVKSVKRKGRMTPLDSGAKAVLSSYCSYLKWLAGRIRTDQSKASVRIREVLNPDNEDATLPLFFFIDSDGKVLHLTVSDLKLAHPMLEELGPNLFRHNFEQRLTAAGVPSQVVEGWMGHSERKRQTYGKDSLRCFADDVRQFREQLDQSCAALDVGVDRTIDVISRFPEHLTVPTLVFPTAVTGTRARELERSKQRSNARNEVRELVADFNSRGHKASNIEEFESLVRAATHKGVGLDDETPEKLVVASHIGIRLDELRSAFPKCKGPFNKSPTICRLKNLLTELPSQFGPDAALAPKRVREMRAQMSDSAEVSRFSAMGCAMVASIRIALLSRVSDKKFFEALFAGKDYRLIKKGKAAFIEYWPDLDTRPKMGVASVQIDQVTERWLKKASREKPSWRTNTGLPAWAKKLLFHPKEKIDDFSESTFWAAFSKILETVRSANQVELPGQLAYLSDNLTESATLPSEPEKALHSGCLYAPVTGLETSFEQMSSGPQPHLSKPDFVRGNKRLKGIVREYKKSAPEKTAQALDALVNQCQLAPFMTLVARWIAHLIRRGKEHGGAYADSSPRKYLSDVISCVTGYEDRQLFELSSEAATELLLDMITKPDKNTMLAGAARVRELFLWAEEMGGPEIEWERLPRTDQARRVRAGVCTEANYNRLLDSLWRGSDRDQRVAFAVIMWRKYGLRLSESFSLMRRNLLHENDRLQVTVEYRSQRPAKSRSGNRTIPPCFALNS